jgi:hypothetical protein
MFGTGKGIRNEAARLKGAATTIRTVAADPRRHGLDEKKIRILNEAASILGNLGAVKGREAKKLIRDERECDEFLDRVEPQARKLIEAWPSSTLAERIAIFETSDRGYCHSLLHRQVKGSLVWSLAEYFRDDCVRDAQRTLARAVTWKAWNSKTTVAEAVAAQRLTFDSLLTAASPAARELMRRIEAEKEPA